MTQHEFKPELGSAFTMMGDIDGYVGLSATGAVTTSNTVLPGMITVSKTGTGEYTFVVDQAFKKCFAEAQVVASVAVDLQAQIANVIVSNTKTTIIVRLLAGAVPTNPSAVCGLYIHLRVSNTSVAKY